MRVVMPGTPTQNVRELSEKELAGLCVGGQITSGVELCNRLRDRGEKPTIDVLVAIADVHRSPTPRAFDNLADALDYWGG